jgi:hypothetical protein
MLDLQQALTQRLWRIANARAERLDRELFR